MMDSLDTAVIRLAFVEGTHNSLKALEMLYCNGSQSMLAFLREANTNRSVPDELFRDISLELTRYLNTKRRYVSLCHANCGKSLTQHAEMYIIYTGIVDRILYPFQ